MRFWNSLTQRLAVTYSLTAALFLGLSFLIIFWSISHVLDVRMNEDLIDDIDEFRVYLETDGIDGVIEEMDRETAAGEHDATFLILVDNDAQIRHQTNMQYWREFELDSALTQNQLDEPHLFLSDFESRDTSTHIIYGRLSPVAVLIIGESAEDKSDILELLAIVLATVFLLALPLIAYSVLYLTRRAIAGIHSVSDAARDISDGNLGRRVNAKNQVIEVQTLADTFDSMTERIQQLIRNTREMTDNIAHDIRSPLGRIKLLSESMINTRTAPAELKQTAASTIAECDRLINLINTSLDVSETEAGLLSSTYKSVELSSLVAEVFELFEPAAELKDIRTSITMIEQSTVLGNSGSLQRMIANLLDNAIKYSPSGSEIHLCLEDTDQLAQLIISNTGVEIAAENLDRIFDRFYRADSSRSENGCGLGLSYARAVARAHSGDIQVSSPQGRVEFTVTLPSLVRNPAAA